MSSLGNIEAEVKDIREQLAEISRKIDLLTYEREMVSMMKLAENSLSEFFHNEEDLYRISDLRGRRRTDEACVAGY